jgi:UMF1 family MFS transporter
VTEGAITIEQAEAALTADQREEIFGWKMYDWGWSAFSTTVTTALLGPYLLALGEDAGGVRILGFTIDEASFYPYVVSLSALLQVLILPVVGAAADYTDQKKKLMLGLSYLGSIATAGLFVVREPTIVLGGVLFLVAAVAFSAASVIYNSYLPDIAPPVLRDRISSAGFAVGYLGGGVWLAANFVLIALLDDGLAVRLSLGGTGLWALYFIWRYPGRMLRPRPAARTKPPGARWLNLSIGSVFTTLKELRRDHPVTFRYLIAYLIFNDGIATVITVATSFAADELDASATTLLLLVLLIQFVAIPGAVAFGRLAERVGAKRALMANLVVWVLLVVYAYLLLTSVAQLWVMGVVLAVVLGGSQALSRSLYAQMVPGDKEAEYFGFYEIAARGTSWIGPLAFAVANEILDSQRQAILVLVVFFVVGLGLLAPVQVRKGMLDAGQDPTGVVL